MLSLETVPASLRLRLTLPLNQPIWQRPPWSEVWDPGPRITNSKSPLSQGQCWCPLSVAPENQGGVGSTWHFKQYKGQTSTGKDEGNQEVQLLLRVQGAEQQMVGLGAGEPRSQSSSDSSSVPADGLQGYMETQFGQIF